MKVFITREIPEIAETLLAKKRYDVSVYRETKPVSRSKLVQKIQYVDAIIPLLTDKIDRTVIDNAFNLKVIANYAVGFNNIDIEYAKSMNIVVTNTPDILTDSTADLAILLLLACARNLLEGEKYVRSKKFSGWQPRLLLGMELKNKILGIVGAGRIGFATAKRAINFGMKIVYFDKNKNERLENETCAKKISLNKLMKISDFISLHLPLCKDTYRMINKDKLDLMKPTAVIINTARGEIVDEEYLIKLLQSNKIYAAGFDVYDNEPIINKHLLKLQNVVLLPHIASATFEARFKMAELAARNVINVLEGKNPITPVY
ncbi:2-hydroxyacid dehydrogenase [Bacteroidota bacterium]